jgi:hypothetical protein
MEPHVHSESTVHWNRSRMAAHLQASHGMQIPMAWDNGKLHQAHLDAHQAVKRPTPKAEEAPMTQTPHAPVPADADDGPRKLYLSEFPGGNWDEAQQETRDYWRHQYAARTLRDAATSAQRPLPRQHTPQSELGDRHAERRIMVDRITAVMAGLDFEREWAADDGIGPNVRGALRVTFQRAAEQTLGWLERGGLAQIPGYLDLLNENVRRERDEALRALRSALDAGSEARRQMGEQQRAMQEMAQAQAASEFQIGDLETTNNELREQLATTGRQLQMALSQKDGLFSEMGEIRRQLDTVTIERDAYRGQQAIDQREHGKSLDAVQQQLEAATAERDGLREQLSVVLVSCRSAGLNGLVRDLEQILAERDIVQQQLVHLGAERDGLARKLAARTQVLDEGRAKLRTLVAEMRRDRWEGSSIYQRLTEILIPVGQAVTEMVEVEDEPVSTVTEASQTEDEVEDALAWARRFAEGGEA